MAKLQCQGTYRRRRYTRPGGSISIYTTDPDEPLFCDICEGHSNDEAQIGDPCDFEEE